MNAPADEKNGICQGMTKTILGKHDRVRCVNFNCLKLNEWPFLMEGMYSLLPIFLKTARQEIKRKCYQ